MKSLTIRKYQPGDHGKVLALIRDCGLEPWVTGYRRTFQQPVQIFVHILVPLLAGALQGNSWMAEARAALMYEVVIMGLLYYLYWEDTSVTY